MCIDCIIIFACDTVATEVMTVFVFHEPSQLSALQDNGLPGVVLNSLLMKNVSNSMICVASLPNILYRFLLPGKCWDLCQTFSVRCVSMLGGFKHLQMHNHLNDY